MEAIYMKWYKQTSVWAVIISVIALILTQLPPIVTWIPSNDVTTEVGARIGLPTQIGIPEYQILLDLKNTGNRSMTISNLELEVIYPNNTVKQVRSESYLKILAGQPSPLAFPITSIQLNIGERWSEMVVFTQPFSPNEEEEVNRFRLQISQSIYSKIRALPPGQFNPDFPAIADERVVAEAINFFNRRFEVEKGTYKVSLSCAINGRRVVLKKFEYTLYDYQINALRSQTEDYKYGAGIFTPPNPNKDVWALISIRN
jgi:hypothetical protein